MQQQQQHPRRLSNLTSALAAANLNDSDNQNVSPSHRRHPIGVGSSSQRHSETSDNSINNDNNVRHHTDVDMAGTAVASQLPPPSDPSPMTVGSVGSVSYIQQLEQEQQEAFKSDRVAMYRRNPPASGISLFSHRSAPNGFKVAVVLAELGIAYKTFYLDFKKNEQRSPYYVAINPNARVPAIVDHDNGDHALWESGAILVYLCQRAGPNCPLWSDDYIEQSKITSWVFFQASGHAPMIGQALHFRYFHPEMVESAIERYVSEVRRIYSVIEMTLAEKREVIVMELDDKRFNGHEPEDVDLDPDVWLVGDRLTIADLAFVTWNHVVDRIGINLKLEFPEVYRWTKAMISRPAVARALSGAD